MCQLFQDSNPNNYKLQTIHFGISPCMATPMSSCSVFDMHWKFTISGSVFFFLPRGAVRAEIGDGKLCLLTIDP